MIEQLGVSRYAPVDINAYQYNGLKGLSFGQLIISVCCRRAAAIEQQSVLKMNEMTATTDLLKETSAVAERVFTASSVSAADKTFMMTKLEIAEADIDISSYDKRTALFAKIKPKLDQAASQSQQQAIDLQSLVSRRDVTYNASAATVRTLMQSALGMAATIG